MWYLWSVPVVIVVFLWKLNAHLRGRLKNKTAAVLFWTIIGLIVAAFPSQAGRPARHVLLFYL